MAKAAKAKQRERAKWQGYVNYRPTEEEQREIRGNLLTSDKALARLQEIADDGYRVSIKHDHYRGTQTLEVYSQWADMPNAGYTLVVAHDDLLVSASAIDHFLREVAENGEWPTQARLDNPYSW